MVINNTSSSNGDNNDNGNNAYITSEVHLSNEARNSLEMQKKSYKNTNTPDPSSNGPEVRNIFSTLQ